MPWALGCGAPVGVLLPPVDPFGFVLTFISSVSRASSHFSLRPPSSSPFRQAMTSAAALGVAVVMNPCPSEKPPRWSSWGVWRGGEVVDALLSYSDALVLNPVFAQDLLELRVVVREGQFGEE